MNDHKISFLICTNNENYLTECQRYIRELTVPEGYSTDIIPITGAPSMTAGYNQGMKLTDAKYKVYLHQDVFILNQNFILDTLKILQQNVKIGMIGMVGTKRLPDNGCMWTTPMRTGALRSFVLNTVDDYFDLPVSSVKGFAPVQAVDGLLMMTQYDIPWRDDLNLGWDFYDVSQSLEFARQGYRIVVPYQTIPWVLHDNGFLHLGNYHTARKKFLQAYFPERTDEIAACTQAAHQAAEHSRQLQEADKIIQQVLEFIAQAQKQSISQNTVHYLQQMPESTTQMPGQFSPLTTMEDAADALYRQAVKTLRFHLKEFQEHEAYCILCFMANIDEAERSAGVPGHLFSRIKPDLLWIHRFYQQIKFHIWQLQYPFPADIQYESEQYLQTHLSEVALQYFQTVTYPA